jgi:hypothetical protein
MIKALSKPWPWNKLADPRPADWGIGMTVCIAAICTSGDDNAVITVSDSKVSMGGYFSADKMAYKTEPVLGSWMALMAGDDISHATPILEMMAIAKTMLPTLTLDEITSLAKSSYRKQRAIVAEDRFLSPYNMTLDEFKSSGRDVFLQETHAEIIRSIRDCDLKLEILFGGFDKSKAPHIFRLGDPGDCDYYDKVGFWSIGSGQHAALSTLFAHQYNRTESLGTCVFKVLAAKYTAESAIGVGEDTHLMVSFSKSPWMSFVADKVEAKVKAQWKRLPKIPKQAPKLIDDELKHNAEFLKKAFDAVAAKRNAAAASAAMGVLGGDERQLAPQPTAAANKEELP